MFVYRMVLALLFLAFALPSFAALVPENMWKTGVIWTAGPEYGRTAEEACLNLLAAVNSVNTNSWTYTDGGVKNLTATSGNCSFLKDGSTTGALGSGVSKQPSKSCPKNSTGVETCTCNPGYSENVSTNSCVLDQEPTDDEKCKLLAALYNSTSNPNREGRVPGKLDLETPQTVCMPNDPEMKMGPQGYKPPPGCKHEFTGNMNFESADGSGWKTEGTSWGMMDGAGLACVPGLDPASNPEAPPTVQPDPPCKGTQGSVNGVDVCIAASSGNTRGVDWNQITDANGNTSTVRTNVECSGEKCTVTTTTTPNASNNGGTGGSSTTNTSSVSRDQYCANNPKSVVCGGSRDSSGVTRGQDGSGSGSGGDDGDDDVTAPGAPGGQIPELWKKKYPDGVKGVWDSKSAELKESGLGGLASSLMPSISDGGSQPSWQVDLDFGGYWSWGVFTLSPDPAVWSALRAFTIICALVLARRLVFGG